VFRGVLSSPFYCETWDDNARLMGPCSYQPPRSLDQVISHQFLFQTLAWQAKAECVGCLCGLILRLTPAPSAERLPLREFRAVRSVRLLEKQSVKCAEHACACSTLGCVLELCARFDSIKCSPLGSRKRSVVVAVCSRSIVILCARRSQIDEQSKNALRWDAI
jgi:hypothetical protein